MNNKPKINHIEVEGDHDANYYGLGTYNLPEGGIPESDLADVKAGIEKLKETEQQVFSLVSSTFRIITEFNRHSCLLHTIVGNDAFEYFGINGNGTLEEFYRSLSESTAVHPNDRLYLLERLSPKSII